MFHLYSLINMTERIYFTCDLIVTTVVRATSSHPGPMQKDNCQGRWGLIVQSGSPHFVKTAGDTLDFGVNFQHKNYTGKQICWEWDEKVFCMVSIVRTLKITTQTCFSHKAAAKFGVGMLHFTSPNNRINIVWAENALIQPATTIENSLSLWQWGWKWQWSSA